MKFPGFIKAARLNRIGRFNTPGFECATQPFSLLIHLIFIVLHKNGTLQINMSTTETPFQNIN
jgi:hypothetical protein